MRTLTLSVAALLTFFLGSDLLAGTITVGSVNSFGSFPFSAEGLANLSRYQQVYASTAFSGPGIITAFSVFVGAYTTSNIVDTGTFSVFFSTTARAVNGLSTTFASNLGIDDQLFGTYTLSGTVPDTLVFNATNPFAYNPSAGNLLMDILISNVTTANHRDASNNLLIHYFADDTTGSVTSSADNSFSSTEATSFGNVTTFTTSTTTPEPAGYMLIIAPLAFIWMRQLRMRSKKT